GGESAPGPGGRSTRPPGTWWRRTRSAAARAAPGRHPPPRTGGRGAAGSPILTIRDQVAAEVVLADTLGIGSWAAVVGGSMGGMRALEWSVGHPDRVNAQFLLACT